MKMMDWHIGQRFTVSSMNYAGHDLEFKIVGVLPGERWSHNFFFRDDYFHEATGDKDRFHMMWVRVRDPETGKRVAGEIERMFDKSDTEVLVETESKGVARLTERTHSHRGDRQRGGHDPAGRHAGHLVELDQHLDPRAAARDGHLQSPRLSAVLRDGDGDRRGDDRGRPSAGPWEAYWPTSSRRSGCRSNCRRCCNFR